MLPPATGQGSQSQPKNGVLYSQLPQTVQSLVDYWSRQLEGKTYPVPQPSSISEPSSIWGLKGTGVQPLIPPVHGQFWTDVQFDVSELADLVNNRFTVSSWNPEESVDDVLRNNFDKPISYISACHTRYNYLPQSETNKLIDLGFFSENNTPNQKQTDSMRAQLKDRLSEMLTSEILPQSVQLLEDFSKSLTFPMRDGLLGKDEIGQISALSNLINDNQSKVYKESIYAPKLSRSDCGQQLLRQAANRIKTNWSELTEEQKRRVVGLEYFNLDGTFKEKKIDPDAKSLGLKIDVDAKSLGSILTRAGTYLTSWDEKVHPGIRRSGFLGI